MTNNHVVDHADKIVVSLTDGRQLPAHVLGTDELTDVAVIKIDAPAALTSVTWGDSRQVEVGDWILAAGNPFGLGGSVTAGIVSAEGRDLGSGPFDNFLQLDAPINPGNSGGPIFNMDGQVIGVSTAIVSPSGGSVGIGFAIPSEIVSNVVANLLAHGSIVRGWLGVSVEDVDNGGVIIAGVEHDGPALHAGVHRRRHGAGAQRRPYRHGAQPDPCRRRHAAGQCRPSDGAAAGTRGRAAHHDRPPAAPITRLTAPNRRGRTERR